MNKKKTVAWDLSAVNLGKQNITSWRFLNPAQSCYITFNREQQWLQETH